MSADILDRIDATIAAWEAAPESWVPGDPLYEDPRMAGENGRQVVRSMCWMCGEERPLDLFDGMVVHTASRCTPVPRTATVNLTIDTREYVRALNRLYERVVAMGPSGPPPLPIDAYRRRRRSR